MPADPPKLMPVADVDRLLADRSRLAAVETVALSDAAGRVLRQEVRAERPSPPFHRSAMDGICVARSALAAGKRRFAVAGVQRAGQAASQLPSADVCMEIMTGAVLPEGADAVIQIEHLDMVDGHAVLPTDYATKPMQNVHIMGSDHAADDLLLSPGRRLEAPQIAILASCGVARVDVAAALRIAIIATGDELVPVDGELAPHQIRMSNLHAIAAGVRRAGPHHVQAIHLRDELDAMRRDMAAILDEHDIVVLSGGISVGKYDFVGQVLTELGVDLHITKVQQRPGKPFAFGSRERDGLRVFALPGNPVSATICMRRYLLPYLRRAAGLRPPTPLVARLGAAYDFKPTLTLYLPVTFRYEPGGDALIADPAPTNGSGDWGTLGETDGFVEIPAGQHHSPAGAVLAAYPWTDTPFV